MSDVKRILCQTIIHIYIKHNAPLSSESDKTSPLPKKKWRQCVYFLVKLFISKTVCFKRFSSLLTFDVLQKCYYIRYVFIFLFCNTTELHVIYFVIFALFVSNLHRRTNSNSFANVSENMAPLCLRSRAGVHRVVWDEDNSAITWIKL